MSLTRKMSYTCREAIYILSVLSCPAHSSSPSKNILQLLIFHLQLSDEMKNKYDSLLDAAFPDKEKSAMASPYLQLLHTNNHDLYLIVFELLFVLYNNNLYTGTGRVYLKSMCRLFNISPEHWKQLEQNLTIFIQAKYEASKASSQASDSSTMSTFLRYSKIGLATVGIGTAAAVAGDCPYRTLLSSH